MTDSHHGCRDCGNAMHAWCVSRSDPGAKEGSGSMGRCTQPATTTATMQNGSKRKRTPTIRSKEQESDADVHRDELTSTVNGPAVSSAFLSVSLAKKMSGKGSNTKSAAKSTKKSKRKQSDAADEEYEPEAKKQKLTKQATLGQLGIRKFSDQERTIDRTGAPPAAGVNKGLSMAERMEDAEKSKRARDRTIPKR